MADAINPAEILLLLLRIFESFIFFRILLSWVAIDPEHAVVRFLYRVTDPVLLPVRELFMRLLDRLGVQMPVDFSPILVFILIHILERTVILYAQ